MQDKAAPYRARVTTMMLEDENVDVLPWVARSPDLNPMENLWRIIARRVYYGDRQFETIVVSKDCIQEVWDSISVDMLKNLSRFLPNRVTEIIRMRGQ